MHIRNFIVFCALLLVLPGHSAGSEIRKIDMASGMPTNNVWEIYQDNYGLIWLGTSAGLIRFDGRSFENYGFPNFMNHAFQDNAITFIKEGKEGNLWIGTRMGFCQFNRATKSFLHPKNKEISEANINAVLYDNDNDIWLCLGGPFGLYNYTKNKRYSIKSDTLQFYTTNNIFELSDNILLVSTSAFGVFTFNKKTGEITKQFPFKVINHKPMVVINDSNNFWLVSRKGLYKMDVASHNNIKYKLHVAMPYNYESYHNVRKNGTHQIWLVTTSGIFIYNTRERKVIPFNKNNLDKPITFNDLSRVFFDKYNNTWLTYKNNGIDIIYNQYKNLELVSKGNDAINCLNDLQVKNTIYIGNNEYLLSTQGGGLNIYNRETKSCEYYRLYPELPQKLTGQQNKFFKLFRFNKDIVLAANETLGLYQFNLKTKTLSANFGLNAIKKIRDNNVTDIVKNNDNNLLISTLGSGLYKIDIENDKILEHYHSTAPGKLKISSDYISDILLDTLNNIWLASTKGLISISPKGKIGQFNASAKKNSLWTNEVTCLYEDHLKNIWIGTQQGLNHYNRFTQRIQRYEQQPGNSANSIKAIIQDKNNKLWISSKKEIIAYNLENHYGIDYFNPEGYVPQPCSYSGISILPDSSFALSTAVGIMFFNPENRYMQKNGRKIYINKIETASLEQVGELKTFPLEMLDTTDNIRLSHKQNTFTIDVTALEFTNYSTTTYYFMLKGFDKDWRTESEQHKITYTNIPPGKYEFVVKAFNKRSLWITNEKQLTINILPPFYKKVEFRTAVSITLLFLIFFIPYNIIRKIERQKEYLETLVEKRTNEIKKQNTALQEQSQELKRLNTTKDKLFNIIAHDLKDPFNQIIGFSSLLKRKYYKYNDEKRLFQIDLIYNSANKYFSLLENMLSWARTQTNRLNYTPTKFNLNVTIQDTLQQIEDTAANKDITLVFNNDNDYVVFADASLFNIVLRNLLTNAIKFTGKNGLIIIGTRKTGDHVEISVQDNGIGIPAHKQQDLFSTETITTNAGTEGEKGTGLGLLICKEMVKTNKGRLWLHSIVNEGTTFYFTVPSC